MLQKLYHTKAHESLSEAPAIHSSLVPHLLGVSFAQLTPDEARRLVAGNVESVLSDFVSEAREKGVLR